MAPLHLHIDEPICIAPGSEDVHDAIRNILADEYPDLAASHGDRVDRKHHLLFPRYFKAIFQTLAGVASSFVRMLSFEISAYTPPFCV